MVVIAWEHDKTPNQALHVAYRGAAAAIDAAIRGVIDNRLQVIREQGIDAVTALTTAERAVIVADVKAAIKRPLSASLGVGTLNFDDFIGGDSVLVEIEDARVPFSSTFSVDLRKREGIGAHYQVTGPCAGRRRAPVRNRRPPRTPRSAPPPTPGRPGADRGPRWRARPPPRRTSRR